MASSVEARSFIVSKTVRGLTKTSQYCVLELIEMRRLDLCVSVHLTTIKRAVLANRQNVVGGYGVTPKMLIGFVQIPRVVMEANGKWFKPPPVSATQSPWWPRHCKSGIGKAGIPREQFPCSIDPRSILVTSSSTRPTRATSSRWCYDETASVEFKLNASVYGCLTVDRLRA